MRRFLSRRSVLGVLLLLAVVAAGYLVVSLGEGSISQANCDKLELGWSLDKVEQVFHGAPKHRWFVPGFNATFGGNTVFFIEGDAYEKTIPALIMRHGPPVAAIWRDEDGNCIAAKFDKRGLYDKSFIPTDLPFRELMKNRIERRFGVRWR